MAETSKIEKPEIVIDKNSAKIGKNLNFAGKESYKLLRTNILLSFAGERSSKVIGITSAEVADGKTTTSANLAFSIAESGSKCVLVEGDMRRKNADVLESLGCKSEFGLSNKLAGQCKIEDILVRSSINRNLYVIGPGDIPPNPSELLLSVAMENVIESLKLAFDYIIIDLPPINLVNDALAATKLLDGVVMVARSEKTRKGELSYAINQLKFADCKVLGIVLNDYDIFNKSYGYYKRGYHGRYYRKYYNSRYYSKYNYYGYYGSSSKKEDKW